MYFYNLKKWQKVTPYSSGLQTWNTSESSRNKDDQASPPETDFVLLGGGRVSIPTALAHANIPATVLLSVPPNLCLKHLWGSPMFKLYFKSFYFLLMCRSKIFQLLKPEISHNNEQLLLLSLFSTHQIWVVKDNFERPPSTNLRSVLKLLEEFLEVFYQTSP